jgi:cell division protease FtsH
MGNPSASRPPSLKGPSEPGTSGPFRLKSWLPLLVLLLSFLAFRYFTRAEESGVGISYSAFYKAVSENRVESITLRGQELSGNLRAPASIEGRTLRAFHTVAPAQEDRELLPLLREKGVTVAVKSEQQPLLVEILLSLLPFALIVGVWVWMSRRAQNMLGSGGPLAGMLQGRSRRFEQQSEVVTRFNDVAGLKAAKQDLQEIVQFLKEPERYRRLGGKVPRGVLLVGPPGTGKTLLARAVAGEAGVPFFSINGSEFIELFVGVGASRVRELFEATKAVAPAIVFIDEIDAVGRSRGAGLGGGHDEREQTLNQLLSEMDGFSRNDLTIVLAATNRPDVLDPALLRPGRFDRRVIIDRPELQARAAILAVHVRGKPLAEDVDLDAVARRTPGFSGADLANLVNEAALNATRRGTDAIAMSDFNAAHDKIVLGDPRETKLDPDEKLRVAVHEAGHAVVTHFAAHAEPLERVTIIPRGMALGATQQTAGRDRHLLTEAQLADTLRGLLGGYAAERTVFGEVSSGAENDLKRATELAFKMVAHWGMSERIGPVYHEHKTEHPFLGQQLATEQGTSDATVHAIEDETRRVLGEALKSALDTLALQRTGLERLVGELVERESIEAAELAELLGPGPLRAKFDEPVSLPVDRPGTAARPDGAPSESAPARFER